MRVLNIFISFLTDFELFFFGHEANTVIRIAIITNIPKTAPAPIKTFFLKAASVNNLAAGLNF